MYYLDFRSLDITCVEGCPKHINSIYIKHIKQQQGVVVLFKLKNSLKTIVLT